MTSWMECGCGGDVVLYEHPGEERFGRKWMILTGTCRSCGRYHETVPARDLPEYRRLMEEDEVRRWHEEQEARRKEEQELLAKMTPKERLEYLGPDRYPWFYVYVHNEPVRAGSVSEALTLESARWSGTFRADKGQWITIEQNHEILEQWQHGTRPELTKVFSHHKHDMVVHDTGERKTYEGGMVHKSFEDAKAYEEKQRAYWLGRSATFYEYCLYDENGA